MNTFRGHDREQWCPESRRYRISCAHLGGDN